MKNGATAPEATSRAPSNRDLYQEVTNKMIALIEKGVVPWRLTWSTYGLARNYATGHIYSGINLIIMNTTHHSIPYFMSFRQIEERNGRIKKGAKSEMVIYFNIYYKVGDDTLHHREEAEARKSMGEEVEVLKFIKHYNVFNIEDIEGIDFDLPQTMYNDNEKIERCEDIIDRMPKRPELKMLDPNQPFYSPILDIVNMPAITQFESAEAYYATYFHELAHSTGHESRLAREEVMVPHLHGSNPYGKEELLAELAASFVCSMVQINFEPILENSASYLDGWLKVLKEDNKFIFKAAAEAQKAADYILNRHL